MTPTPTEVWSTPPTLPGNRFRSTEYERFTRGEVDFDQMRLNRMAAFLACDRAGRAPTG